VACKCGSVMVVVGRFAPVFGRGLLEVLGDDRKLDVIASDLELSEMERILVVDGPCVVVLDELVGLSRIVGLRSIRRATGIVVLAHEPSMAYGMLLLGVGVTCVARGVSAVEILQAVHVAAGGGRVFVSACGGRIERCGPNDAPLFTSREADVLGALLRGESNGEIALKLGVGVETVRTYVVRVLLKLGMQSRGELVGVRASAREKAED
jgi:DNA-binding NarL/FixJ family response regulator